MLSLAVLLTWLRIVSVSAVLKPKGDEILLNGESIFLRGICMHEQAPLHEGRATTPEEAEMMLKWAREMNCNFVRLAHYPHNEHTVRLADEMGILLWSENPGILDNYVGES